MKVKSQKVYYALLNWNGGTRTRMTLDDIYHNMSEAKFSTLVCQTDIRTKADLKRLQRKGYMVELTAGQFSRTFPQLPIDKIYYSPSLAQTSLYFNPDSLAAISILIPHLFLLTPAEQAKKLKMCLEAIKNEEMKVAEGDYEGSLRTFSNAMRLEYLEMVAKRADSQTLYKDFFKVYRTETFGFSAVSQEFLRQVLEKKTDEDKEKTAIALRNSPDTITIFRGGNTLSVPHDRAFSWTTDINIASFFAARQGNGPGYLARAIIRREDVIDYFPEYFEREIIVDPAARSFQFQDAIEVKGLDYLDKVLPIVTPMFHRYRDQLYRLDFVQKSAVHGLEHEARVLLMCLILANELKLPKKDVAILCAAALYHDVRRDNDSEDMRHGAMGRVYYEKSVSKPDPLVRFLCEFHCLPDETGLERIKSERSLGRTEEETIRLFNVFKDADALDRVRFGIQDVDMNQLRLGISRSMVLVARLVLQNLKV